MIHRLATAGGNVDPMARQESHKKSATGSPEVVLPRFFGKLDVRPDFERHIRHLWSRAAWACAAGNSSTAPAAHAGLSTSPAFITTSCATFGWSGSLRSVRFKSDADRSARS